MFSISVQVVTYLIEVGCWTLTDAGAAALRTYIQTIMSVINPGGPPPPPPAP
jgi:hypothetical protein